MATPENHGPEPPSPLASFHERQAETLRLLRLLVGLVAMTLAATVAACVLAVAEVIGTAGVAW